MIINRGLQILMYSEPDHADHRDARESWHLPLYTCGCGPVLRMACMSPSYRPQMLEYIQNNIFLKGQSLICVLRMDAT